MLIPLNRKKFEDLIPLVATGAQYVYCWGKVSDFLRRLLISIVAVVAMAFFSSFFLGWDFGLVRFLVGLVLGLYWLWGPVYLAGLRNWQYRRYKYTGFWHGEVLDVYVSEELIGKEETVNNLGDLVIVENRERCLNVEVGDETDFTALIQVPLRRSHQGIRRGDVAEMLVLSNRSDLGRIAKISDLYIPRHDIWVSDYPYLRRDAFMEVSRQLARQGYDQPRKRQPREPQDDRPPAPNRSRRSNGQRPSGSKRRPRVEADW